jgi:flagellar motor switch protein FliM
MNNDRRTVNQEEIDARFRTYQKQQEMTADSPAKPLTFRSSRGPLSRIVKQQMHQISVLHEGFARNLASDLGGLLQASTEARLISVEEQALERFLSQMPQSTYWASVDLSPFDAVGVLGLEVSLAFPMLDLLLGGDGATPPTSRDVTDIEEQVLEVVISAICRNLEATWRPLLDIKFAFDRRQDQASVPRVIPLDEKILSLSFALSMPHASGTLSFAFPATVAGVLLRKITEQCFTPKRRTAPTGSASLRERLKKSHFLAEMILPASMVRGSELMNLKAGEVLVLNHHAGDPVLISVAGQTMFSATPVRVGMTRGARVRQQFQPAADTLRETP